MMSVIRTISSTSILLSLSIPIFAGDSKQFFGDTFNNSAPVMTPRDDPRLIINKPITASLTKNEAIIITGSSGLISDEIDCIENSIIDSNHEVNVVHDNVISLNISRWVTTDSISNATGYLDRPDIKQKIGSNKIKYVVSVEKLWWGMNASIWDIRMGKATGIVSSHSYRTYDTFMPDNTLKWISFGAVAYFVPSILMIPGNPLKTKVVAKSDPHIDCKQIGETIGKSINKDLEVKGETKVDNTITKVTSQSDALMHREISHESLDYVLYQADTITDQFDEGEYNYLNDLEVRLGSDGVYTLDRYKGKKCGDPIHPCIIGD